MIWQILVVVILVGANGFFVAAEFALVKVRVTEIESLDSADRKAARTAQHILKHLDAYLSACQLGITLASLGLGWAGEPMAARMIGPAVMALGLPEENVHFVAFPIAFIVITFLHMTVGEQAPKIAAIQKARSTTLLVAFPLRLFYTVFSPFIRLINVSSNGMLRAVGLEPLSGHDQEITEAEVRTILTQSAAMGHLSSRERRMMEKVLDLEDKVARSHMVPRSQIVYLNRNDPPAKSLDTAARSGHTRFPICDGDFDHVRGTIHVKDVFNAMNLGSKLDSLDEVSREALFLPETITLDKLFREFQKRKRHMAILVDEYGGTSGMITLENVFEEMVGPIEDEFDAELPLIVKKGEGRFEVDAACPVLEFADKCGVEVPQDIDVDTIGGVMIAMLGHIPLVGDTVRIGRHQITVLEAERTRVTRLLVEESLPEGPPADVH